MARRRNASAPAPAANGTVLVYTVPDPGLRRQMLKDARKLGHQGIPRLTGAPVAEPQQLTALRKRIHDGCQGYRESATTYFGPILQEMGAIVETLCDVTPEDPHIRAHHDSLEVLLEKHRLQMESLEEQLESMLAQAVAFGNGLAAEFISEWKQSHPHPSTLEHYFTFAEIHIPPDAMSFGQDQAREILDRWDEFRLGAGRPGTEE